MKVSDLAKSSSQTLSQWRTDLNSLEPDELKKLEEQIGCSLEDFNSVGFTRFVAREFYGLRAVISFAKIMKAYEQFKK